MTLVQEVDVLINNYLKWLKDNTLIKSMGNDATVITTPHIDRHNDFLEIVVSRTDNGGYRLSDDGWIIADLEASGCLFNTLKRTALLRETLAGFGIEAKKDEIMTLASAKNFAQKKHNLVQAMLAVNDLFYTASPHVKSLFLEDVQNWLKKNGIRFTPNIKFTGKSGYDHKFDCVIPSSTETPERILKTINNPTRQTALNVISSWEDVKEERGEESQAYVILNNRVSADENKEIPHDVTEALANYGMNSVPWSKRDNFVKALAA